MNEVLDETESFAVLLCEKPAMKKAVKAKVENSLIAFMFQRSAKVFKEVLASGPGLVF